VTRASRRPLTLKGFRFSNPRLAYATRSERAQAFVGGDIVSVGGKTARKYKVPRGGGEMG
jgi:hypothetical protein